MKKVVFGLLIIIAGRYFFNNFTITPKAKVAQLQTINYGDFNKPVELNKDQISRLLSTNSIQFGDLH